MNLPIHTRISHKPLSVNECWQGKRFKTPKYKVYENALMWMLKGSAASMPPAPYRIQFIFAMSNMQSDIDNPVKPLLDILQKRYGFNDRDVMELRVNKLKVPKGQEYIELSIFNINQ